MNKFIISGMIVICVVVGIVFIKAKRVNNDHEPLLTPLSSIKPRSTPLVKKILPSDESMSKKKIVPAVLPTKENQKTFQKSEPAKAIKKIIMNPLVVEKKSVELNAAAKPNSSKKSLKLLSASNSKVLAVPAPPKVVATDNSIQNIQRELQSVIDLNKKINRVQTKKSAQLLRIQEQVLIQQKILNDIQRTTEQNPKKSSPSREALLAQEKLKIIHEESLKNKKILEERDHSKISS